MDFHEFAVDLADRLWDFNFIFKFIAWCINKYCLFVWTSGVEQKILPAFNTTQYSLFYYAIPAYNVILSAMCILYLLDEIPGIMAQRVLLVVGFSLFIVTGVDGIALCRDNDFLPRMMVMSVMCIANAVVLIFHFVKFEDFFKQKHSRERSTSEWSDEFPPLPHQSERSWASEPDVWRSSRSKVERV